MSDKMMRIAGRGDDGLAKALRVDDSGMVQNLNKSKKIVTTLIDNVTIPAGGNTGVVNIGADGSEHMVLLAVTSDKNGWTLSTSSIFASFSPKNSYPIYDKTPIHTSLSRPALSLLLGIYPEFLGASDPSSFSEALDLRVPLQPQIQCRVENPKDEPITVTVKIIRIWR